METNAKKRILDPLIVARSDQFGEVSYIIRAYDRFITVGGNLNIALEILAKFFFILKIKGSKNITMFVNFWLQCAGIVEKDDFSKVFLQKLDS